MSAATKVYFTIRIVLPSVAGANEAYHDPADFASGTVLTRAAPFPLCAAHRFATVSAHPGQPGSHRTAPRSALPAPNSRRDADPCGIHYRVAAGVAMTAMHRLTAGDRGAPPRTAQGFPSCGFPHARVSPQRVYVDFGGDSSRRAGI